MPAAQNFQAGTRGKLYAIAINDPLDVPIETALKIEGWTVDPKIGIARTTHSGSAGFATKEVMAKEASGTMKCTYDALQVPFTEVPALKPKTRMTARLYIGDDPIDNNNSFWYFPVMLIVGVPMVSEVEGMVTYTINWESSGTFTYPVAPVGEG